MLEWGFEPASLFIHSFIIHHHHHHHQDDDHNNDNKSAVDSSAPPLWPSEIAEGCRRRQTFNNLIMYDMVCLYKLIPNCFRQLRLCRIIYVSNACLELISKRSASSIQAFTLRHPKPGGCVGGGGGTGWWWWCRVRGDSGNVQEMRWNTYGLSRAHRCHLEQSRTGGRLDRLHHPAHRTLFDFVA